MNAASWQPDPTHRHELRWWDGNEWTEHISNQGVAGRDPLPPPQPTPTVAPPPSTPPWGAPTIPVPPVPITAVPAATNRRRTGRIAAAIVAVAALGLGGVLLFGGDDESPTLSGDTSPTSLTTPSTTTTIAPATTTPATTVVTSTVASTIPPTTVTTPPTTVVTAPPAATVDVLLAAMPGEDDVPANWSRYSEPNTDLRPQSGPGYGFCGGPDVVTRAQAAGSSAIIDGPSWDLESGGWFGVDAYAFPSEAAATTFMSATEQQANSCMTGPVQYDRTEADMDLFDETVDDSFVWHVAEGSGGFPEATTDADQLLRTVADEYVSGTLDGVDYSTTLSYLSRYERHGRVVLVFWLWGNWGDSGWSEPNPFAFQPTDEAVDAATATVRVQIVQRLAAAGAL